jgi:hypothetical protein
MVIVYGCELDRASVGRGAGCAITLAAGMMQAIPRKTVFIERIGERGE